MIKIIPLSHSWLLQWFWKLFKLFHLILSIEGFSVWMCCVMYAYEDFVSYILDLKLYVFVWEVVLHCLLSLFSFLMNCWLCEKLASKQESHDKEDPGNKEKLISLSTLTHQFHVECLCHFSLVCFSWWNSTRFFTVFITLHVFLCAVLSHSAMSDSLRCHEL